MSWQVKNLLNGNPLDANSDGKIDVRDGLIIGATLQGLQQLDVEMKGSVGKVINKPALDLRGNGNVGFLDGLKAGRAIEHVFKN